MVGTRISVRSLFDRITFTTTRMVEMGPNLSLCFIRICFSGTCTLLESTCRRVKLATLNTVCPISFPYFILKKTLHHHIGDLHHQHPHPLLGDLHLLRANRQDFQVFKTKTFAGKPTQLSKLLSKYLIFLYRLGYHHGKHHATRKNLLKW